jgi:superfamily II DNA helicase RecQ
LIIHRQTISSTQRDSTPLKKLSDTKKDFKSIDEQPLETCSVCPLCQIPFDTAGIHRPVNDACGHTTCFQCFKDVMIKATGCSLCQEEKNSQSDNFNHFEDAFFDEWSLDQSSKTFRSMKTFDDEDTTDFETYENIPSIEDDDDDEDPDKVTWISTDVHDDGPEYRNKEFNHTKTMFERFHALFGLRKFRSNQQEAINCALERRFHLFVLMPTGQHNKFTFIISILYF